MELLEILGWGENEIEDLRFVAYSYVRQGIYETALTLFEGLATISHHSYDLQTLGALHLQKGNNLQALNYLDQALKLDPDNLDIQLNRAKALLSLGYKKQALPLIDKLSSDSNLEIARQAQSLLASFP